MEVHPTDTPADTQFEANLKLEPCEDEPEVNMEVFQRLVGNSAAVACLLGVKVGSSVTTSLSKGDAVLLQVFMRWYAAGFGWSSGPLSFLVPSEIFPLEIRPTGQSINTAVNFATTLVAAFLPETKGVLLEAMDRVWEKHWHWHWRRFVVPDPAPSTSEHAANDV
ncbi:sugar transport protein 5-like [Nymphaea colorata]|nr:sugar transport protein 5-like [Nymphaea colorata]